MTPLSNEYEAGMVPPITEAQMKKVIGTNAVTFTFDNGLDSIRLDVMEVSLENRNHAMLHGFAARIGDNAAIAKSVENGYRVTEEMRREAVLELVNHYTSGTKEWNVRASGVRVKSAAEIAMLQDANAKLMAEIAELKSKLA